MSDKMPPGELTRNEMDTSPEYLQSIKSRLEDGRIRGLDRTAALQLITALLAALSELEEGERVKVEIHRFPNGYEKLFIEGIDLAGSPNGIDAMTVLHYLRWWHGYNIDVRKNFYDEQGNLLTSLEDGGTKAIGAARPSEAAQDSEAEEGKS